MSPDRWEQLQRVFIAALEKEPWARIEFARPEVIVGKVIGPHDASTICIHPQNW